MSAKEVMQMNYMFDRSVNRIIGRRELTSSPEIVDKSAAHINTLFNRYIQKYSQVVDFILLANIYCEKSKAYYNSLFDANEMQVLEEIASQGGIIEISFFAVYDKQKYGSKQEVLEAYEKHNFEVLLSDTKVETDNKEKETQKIKKVWLSDKDKVETKLNSQVSTQESNFYKNNKMQSISSFFKKPA